MDAIILAGGKGTRLKPYTTSFPKPLMPVGKKPILEIVIDSLRESGIKKIFLTVGHLAELIEAYFGNGEKFGVKIIYSKEEKPLGTAGPLNLVKDELGKKFILMNGDILTNIDYGEFIKSHNNSGCLATIALAKRDVFIDFGVIKLDQNKLVSDWIEKPTMNYLVSTGIYLLEKESLKFLPEGFSNLPDLIVNLIKSKKSVGSYIHNGSWLDIGREEDYISACKSVPDD